MFRIWLLGVSVLLASCGGGGGDKSVLPSPISSPVPAPAPLPKELRILVIGQSISSNCNQAVYGPIDNVFQIGKDGSVKPARDPFEWGDCTQGSMWMPLGKRVIDSGLAQKVVFMPIGVGGTSVRDWQGGGKAFVKLNTALDLIKQQGLKFDAVFWHQGSADHGMPSGEYTDRLLSVIAYVNSRISVARWLIGVHSRCWGNYDSQIEAAQRLIGNAASEGRFPGANSNLLGNPYRFDECHLNQAGQEEMANMWLEAIRNARVGQ